MAEQNDLTALSWKEGNNNSNSPWLQIIYTDEHLWTHNVFKNVGLQQQKTTQFATPDNRKPEIQLTKIGKVKTGKTLPGLTSLSIWASLRCRVRFCYKHHESMGHPLISVVKAANGAMVWGIFSWKSLGLLVPTVADNLYSFMIPVYQQNNASFMHHLKSQSGFLNMEIFFVFTDGR